MFTWRSLIALALLACGACDDDDDGARPRYRADLAPAVGGTTQVSMLEDDELERVCASYDAYVETYISLDAIAYILCLPGAIALSGSPEGCERRLDECMAVFPSPIEIEVRVQDTEICIDQLRACDVSVDALEGCANVNLDLALDIVDNWSCRGVDADRRAEAARANDLVSVCANVDSNCARAVAIGPD